MSNFKSDLDWLQEKQKERAKEVPSEKIEVLKLTLRRLPKLESIRLDGASVVGRTLKRSTQGADWYQLWMRASHIFSLVVTAMAQSGTSVKRLDVYREIPRCCIPSGHITSYASSLGTKQLEMMCERLESLNLSMSTEIRSSLNTEEPDQNTVHEHEGDNDDEKTLYSEDESELSKPEDGYLSPGDPRAILSRETPGITRFLMTAPALRELDLSFRNALGYEMSDSYDRIIGSIAHETNFPMLE
ncbi:hypothetical protein N7478_003307 [Penicillium angulare]|uniref:uncharacterized protein n=1 Tax=Penicillium angulare TaxID=116970 RepID=UPI002540F29F|nr:uncharacterized protein N7478_003307 [Penicillium angulare]KAJ5287621.1 hypothetical protein N7478_003307 [Penicillium angulare]